MNTQPIRETLREMQQAILTEVESRLRVAIQSHNSEQGSDNRAQIAELTMMVLEMRDTLNPPPAITEATTFTHGQTHFRVLKVYNAKKVKVAYTHSDLGSLDWLSPLKKNWILHWDSETRSFRTNSGTGRHFHIDA